MTPALTPIQQIFRDALHAAIPDTQLTAAAWADTYRVVSNGPDTGEKWKTDRVPGLREILEAGSHVRVREIDVGGAAQWGKTEGVLNNYIGFYMHIIRVPIMMVQPKKEAGEEYATGRFDPMVRETPVLRVLIEQGRDSGNTRMHKVFPGADFYIASANVAQDLSAKTICLLALDEIDRMPKTVGTPDNPQGDPIALAYKRTTHYQRTGEALVVKTSSATVDGQSRIQQAYKVSDRCEFWCRCPGCDAWQTPHEELCRDPLWVNVKWSELELPAEEARYVCPHCGVILDDDERKEMLHNYRWIPRAAVAEGLGPDMLSGKMSLWDWYSHPAFNGVAGFWFPGTASVFVTMGQMAAEVTKAARENNLEAKQAFVNLTLGELWKPWEEIDKQDLEFRTEHYAAEVPARVVLLTFFIDVQIDRVEVETAGWAVGNERWSIDYRVFRGDPSRVEVEGETTVWDEVWNYLEYEWRHEQGVTMKVRCGCVDTGHQADAVYEFCKKSISRRWLWRENREKRFYWAVKGGSNPRAPIVPKKPTRVGKWNVQLRTIGTEALKDKVAAALKLGWGKDGQWVGGPDSYHFPNNPERVKYEGGQGGLYDEEYFAQVTSERRKPGYHRGYQVFHWEPIRQGIPNEGWDCLVGNLTAKEILKPNLRSYEKVLMEAVARLSEQPGVQDASGPDTPPTPDDDGDGHGGEQPPPQSSPPRSPNTFRLPRGRGGYNPRRW